MADVAEVKDKKKTTHGTASHIDLKPGDMLSWTSYLTVVSKDGSDLTVVDETGKQFDIRQGGNLVDNLVTNLMHSANQFSRTEALTRTEIVEKLLKAGDAIFTVEYHKQVDPNKAFEQVKTGNKLEPHDEQKKKFKKAVAGELRQLTGHLLSAENNLGRSLVYDLKATSIKQIDHRTIQWLILKGVKYIVK